MEITRWLHAVFHRIHRRYYFSKATNRRWQARCYSLSVLVSSSGKGRFRVPASVVKAAKQHRNNVTQIQCLWMLACEPAFNGRFLVFAIVVTTCYDDSSLRELSAGVALAKCVISCATGYASAIEGCNFRQR